MRVKTLLNKSNFWQKDQIGKINIASIKVTSKMRFLEVTTIFAAFFWCQNHKI